MRAQMERACGYPGMEPTIVAQFRSSPDEFMANDSGTAVLGQLSKLTVRTTQATVSRHRTSTSRCKF